MKNRRKLILSLITLLVFSQSFFFIKAEQETTSASNSIDINTVDTFDSLSYEQYIKNHNDKITGVQEIVLINSDISKSTNVEIMSTVGSEKVDAALTTDQSTIEWKFNVSNPGLYNIKIHYYNVKGKGSAIERAIYINNEIPFKEAGYLSLPRAWQDTESYKIDSAGNDIRSQQVEFSRWSDYVACDSTGYIADKLSFFFKQGENTLKLVSLKEPVIIDKITLFNENAIPSYDEYSKTIPKDESLKTSGEKIGQIEAENCYLRSDTTIYKISDKSSFATSPQSAKVTKLNTIGSDRWKIPGQWLTWKFQVAKTGYYKIAPRFKQNIYSGGYTSRKLFIDGEIPFKEAEVLKFNYSESWQLNYLGNGNQEYVFYLEEGEHELTLEVVLGEMATVLRDVEQVLNSLNSIYRKVLTITGPTPDVYRDYNFKKLIPDEIIEFGKCAEILQKCADKLEAMSGSSGEYTATIKKLVYQLKKLNITPEKIADNFIDFKTNIGSLGSWILIARQQPLQLDYFIINPVDSDTLPKAEASIFDGIVFELQCFIQSFFREYNTIATTDNNNSTETSTITAWIATGRDQAQIIRSMIDDTFSNQFNIRVNLQLTAPATILPATLAGIGPDVSLSTDGSYPINFAIRNGVLDLSRFADFNDVAKRFYPSALTPYTFLDKVYALPETQSFPMLFYRKDIFKELNLNVPKTWDDLYKIIPELKKNNMEIGLPPSYGGFMLMLYQRNGDLYINNGEKSNLDSDIALDSFKEICDLFTQYSFPVAYDFSNRFRTGEMPIAIQDYTAYNQLTVFAPEIKGLWDFTTVPGYLMENGEINNTVPGSGLAVMMMSGVEDEDKAWEFMKWWTSTDTQGRFGIEMESILGASAKYPTANIEAVERLPWTSNELNKIKAAWEKVRGIPEVPGSYYTARNIDFAFNSVYNKQLRPVDTLMKYIDEINRELTRKRDEFGLK